MSSDLPPVPPRPDLARPPAAWRFVEPGGMGATGIVRAGFRIWQANWPRWAVVVLVMSGILAVVIAALDPWTARYGTGYWIDQERLPGRSPHGAVILLALIGALLFAPWELVVLTRAALRATFDDPLSGTALIGRTIRAVPSVLWIFVLLFVAGLLGAFLVTAPFAAIVAVIAPATGSVPAIVFLPLLLLFLFLFWLVPRLFTVPDVLVGEDARGTRAVAGAWRLSRGAWGTSAGALILLFLIGLAIGLVAGVLGGAFFPDAVVADAVPRAILQSLLNALVTPLAAAVTAALYLELRARKGVLDQEALRAKLARFD